MEIQRFELSIAAEQVINVPKNAEILSAAIQHGSASIALYMLVNESLATVGRKFRIKCTGENADDVQDHDKFVDSLQGDDPYLVLHIFDGGEVDEEDR